MTIEELSGVINMRIDIANRPNWGDADGLWYASFKGAEVKGDGVLIGCSGNGATPQKALQAYVDEIRGKTLVFNAMSENRIEVQIPELLESNQ